MFENLNCPDCGSAPTIHWAQRLDSRVEIYLLPLFKPLEKIQLILRPIFKNISPKLTINLIKLAVFLRLGEIVDRPDEKTNYRGRCFWKEADSRGIKMFEFRIFGIYTDTFFAEYNSKYIFFDGLPRPKGNISESLEWMDNKTIMNTKFLACGFPVAKSGEAKNLAKALKIFSSLSKPLIVKPSLGSRSRHTTLHIEDVSQLKIAFLKAKIICPWVTIQQELVGSVFRATLINKKLIAVLRRDPAAVEGDGVHTIKQLLDIENSLPLRQGPLFHQIPLNEETNLELSRQLLTWESVPQKDKIVNLGVKTSRGSGGAIVDVTQDVHSDNIVLFEKIAEFLDDPLIGVDFIIADIKKSWKDQDNCGVIECNSLPFIDLHHYPLKGQSRNVAGALWDIIYPETKPANYPKSF